MKNKKLKWELTSTGNIRVWSTVILGTADSCPQDRILHDISYKEVEGELYKSLYIDGVQVIDNLLSIKDAEEFLDKVNKPQQGVK